MSYPLPPVGSRIVVGTVYPNHYYLRDKEDPAQDCREQVYVGTVINAPWQDGDVFSIQQANGEARRPVLNRRHVAWLILDGAQVAEAEESNHQAVYIVPGSKGGEYTVTQVGDSVTCTCPGYQYRGMCYHQQAARDGKLHPTP